MLEAGIGLGQDTPELAVGDAAGNEGTNHGESALGIGPAGAAADFPRGELPPGLRKVEPAVAGPAGNHHPAKRTHRGLAPGRAITHPQPPTHPKPPGADTLA